LQQPVVNFLQVPPPLPFVDVLLPTHSLYFWTPAHQKLVDQNFFVNQISQDQLPEDVLATSPIPFQHPPEHIPSARSAAPTRQYVDEHPILTAPTPPFLHQFRHLRYPIRHPMRFQFSLPTQKLCSPDVVVLHYTLGLVSSSLSTPFAAC
uniref:DUF4587 domain-containing protein n=1 Tax=Haemonchus placei TaxID=6290 RepID=A0A158QQQ4_HAEPC